MLVCQKNGFDHYYCIKSFGRKKLQKVHFCITIMVGKSMKVLKMPVPEQRLASA